MFSFVHKRAGALSRRGLLATVAALTTSALARIHLETAAAAPQPVSTEGTFTPTAPTTINGATGGSNWVVTNSGGNALFGRATGSGHFGAGVVGDSQTYHGIVGTSTGGAGVYGSVATSQASLYGYGQTDGPGVNGTSVQGIGVLGTVPSSNVGVYGSSAGGVGVYGTSGGIGVAGRSSNQPGVWGESVNGNGVYAKSTNNNGIYTTSTNGTAMFAESNIVSTYAYSPTGVALIAQTSTGKAGQFYGNVDIDGNLTVAGMKSAVVPGPKGQLLRVFCVESPVSVFEDYGQARLTGGSVRIELNPEFAAIVKTEAGYFIYVTPHGETLGLFVTGQDKSGFVVKEQGNGSSDVAFHYRVVALRRDIETSRLPVVPDFVGAPGKRPGERAPDVHIRPVDPLNVPPPPRQRDLPPTPEVPGQPERRIRTN